VVARLNQDEVEEKKLKGAIAGAFEEQTRPPEHAFIPTRISSNRLTAIG
jgi:hypothetical protein